MELDIKMVIDTVDADIDVDMDMNTYKKDTGLRL
jgi:hypothetical protein